MTEQALLYIEENGTSLERWVARRIAGRTERLPADFAAKQTPEGGWRSKESGPDGPVHMGTTCLTLLDFAFLGLQETDACKRTVEYMRGAQQPDGRWTENPAQLLERELPDYNRPGDVKVDLWVTANALAALIGLGYGNDERVRKGVEWVLAHEEEKTFILFPGFHHTLFAMAAVAELLGDEKTASRYWQRIVEHLEKFKQERWYDIMDVTWALKLMVVAKLPRMHEAVEAFLQELEKRREEDGIWRSIYGGHESFTMDALTALRFYN